MAASEARHTFRAFYPHTKKFDGRRWEFDISGDWRDVDNLDGVLEATMRGRVLHLEMVSRPRSVRVNLTVPLRCRRVSLTFDRAVILSAALFDHPTAFLEE